MKPYSILLVLALMWCNCSRTSTDETKDSSTSFVALTPEQNQAWVNEHLDSVMVPMNFTASNEMVMPYRLFVPPSYNTDTEIPLFIHLHGRGERGTDNRPALYNNLPLFNGPNSIVSPNSQHAYPCIVLVPQCSDKTINEEWARWVGNSPETPFEGLGKDGSYTMTEDPSASGVAVQELIDAIMSEYVIDKSRVYITGISMGGFGTWEYVGRRPELFAAAVPMAGFSDPSIVEKVKHIPFWIFHGGADTGNPTEGSRTMYKLLTDAGATVKYTEYPGVEHSPAFQLAWNEPDLIPWIFAQRKGRSE